MRFVFVRDPQPGLTPHTQGLWPQEAGRAELPLREWLQHVQHCWSVNSKIALLVFSECLKALPTGDLSQCLFHPELVVLVTGFLSLPWMQRHVGKGVDVGE